MNLPNSLTIARIILIPIFVVILLVRIPYGDFIAALIFSIAALTDSLDGYLARKRREVTNLGIILDPLADKLLVTAALISLIELNRIPGWTAIVILGREFAVTGLRAVKAEAGIVIPASWMGKLKTIIQIAAIIMVILEKSFQQFLTFPLGLWMLYLAVAVTVVSGVEYFYRYKIEESALK
ncbi:MAG TPA: CDP-diacylglycerol--glycerol-3-phosphate 3-phosphatidyltransferase [Syntrophomonadaceae bacterium]|nr:CDP-diacylglycerol--glycerol-3-phosphate 3-phosphatidyltransferase [Syntrophomonadaceae bacterium]HOQ08890.1 CDP-diacylglycerol--glycerol-3-phosphate 3-phosphatidyltransferase [Syntrophomonadaceae bacterium]HPU47701.1 CDP-diacylglycerol--glycerol-3-phosphate 3-phosphatidyltransferase [Syntrophomonadaceae bacterium]